MTINKEHKNNNNNELSRQEPGSKSWIWVDSKKMEDQIALCHFYDWMKAHRIPVHAFGAKLMTNSRSFLVRLIRIFRWIHD